MKRLSAILVLLLVVSPIVADDTPPEPNPTVEAWTALQAAQAESQTLRDAVSGLFQKMETEEGKAAAREVFMTALKRGGALVTAAEKDFRESFDASDWEQWDKPEYADLFRTGLDLSARHALDTDPKKALKTYELLVKHFPDSAEGNYAKSTWLPIALPAAGDYDHALKRLEELHDQVEGADKFKIRMAGGDTLCIKGDTEAALEVYKKAIEDIDAAATGDQAVDPYSRERRYLELRVNLIGKPAPEVDSKHWFGAEARKLSDLKGTVVVLDYWATW